MYPTRKVVASALCTLVHVHDVQHQSIDDLVARALTGHVDSNHVAGFHEACQNNGWHPSNLSQEIHVDPTHLRDTMPDHDPAPVAALMLQSFHDDSNLT